MLDWKSYSERYYAQYKDCSVEEIDKLEQQNDLNTNGRGQMSEMALIISEVIRKIRNERH